MRVLVCGGRDYDDRAFIFGRLDALDARRGITVVIHGAADGADALADEWARSRGKAILDFPARWEYGDRYEGRRRNGRMLHEGKPDCVVAFPGGPGTAHMVEISRGRVVVWQPAIDPEIP